MADQDKPRPDEQRPKSQPPRFAGGPRQRESAGDRRERQIATAVAAQADLKREAAERRARKNAG